MNIADLEDSLNLNPNGNRIEEEEEEEEEGIRAGRIANAVAFPMALKTAVELGVIDAIHAAGEGDWLSPREIACRIPTKPGNPHAPMMLDRILRLLASYSIVKCRTVRTQEDGGGTEIERVYASKPICRFFLNDSQGSGSLFPLFLVSLTDVYINMWSHLKDMIIEGKDPFTCANGTGLYEYLARNEPFHELFHRAMSEHSTMIMKKILRVYKGFEGVNVLVDLGGGDGTSLSLVTAKHPHIRGINFDLLDVVAKAPTFPGVEHVAGDMFVEIPKADAIFTKRSIHGWNDEESVKILRNCWKSLPDKGKVIIVETVVPTNLEGGREYANLSFDLDVLLMALLPGGRERTRAEFEGLARRSGFARCEFVCRAYYCWVIEFHKETGM
ncbi:PREDICTED: indole glucosinolate O-methyltransferase 4-like [Tarenaya hassleriana]|uniref:indole glucosinolate O-methyltransferase 4-like n=1 Tax=Tarenaya hassleriana TaxID=28532 RepID=UPI00053CA5BA|nr:PREDICTED: indole glucosinolate O-methyltransferase 4-like [Tarenaya hassleriana]